MTSHMSDQHSTTRQEVARTALHPPPPFLRAWSSSSTRPHRLLPNQSPGHASPPDWPLNPQCCIGTSLVPPPPWDPKFFHCHVVFGKTLHNNSLAHPLWESVRSPPPPRKILDLLLCYNILAYEPTLFVPNVVTPPSLESTTSRMSVLHSTTRPEVWTLALGGEGWLTLH